MIWAWDFVSNQVMEIPEYFVYFGIFMMHSWSNRSGQIAKGEFLEVPQMKMGAKIPQQSSPSCGCSCGYTPYERILLTGMTAKGSSAPLFCLHPYSVSWWRPHEQSYYFSPFFAHWRAVFSISIVRFTDNVNNYPQNSQARSRPGCDQIKLCAVETVPSPYRNRSILPGSIHQAAKGAHWYVDFSGGTGSEPRLYHFHIWWSDYSPAHRHRYTLHLYADTLR